MVQYFIVLDGYFAGSNGIDPVSARTRAMYYQGPIVFLLFLLSLIAGPCLAATQTVSAAITFDSMLTVTKSADINFGNVKADQVGTYVISPTGAVTASDGGVVLGGSSQVGNLTISGSTTQAIDIMANNYVADNGVIPSNATCSYDGGVASSCSLSSQTAPGVGKILLVGITVAVDGEQDAGMSAAPTFDFVVNYH